jgi:hypothetical protein
MCTDTSICCDMDRHGPRTTPGQLEAIRDASRRSLKKFVARASRELHILRLTIPDMVHRRLQLTGYKVQLVQKLQENGSPRRCGFAVDILCRIDEDSGHCSDEVTFHISGKVNCHSCRIWGFQKPYVVWKVAQSVQCLTTDRTAAVRSPTEAEDFSSNLCVQTGSGDHPASRTVGTGGSFPGG